MSNLKSGVSVEETFDVKKGRLQGRERTDFKIGGQQWRGRDVRFEDQYALQRTGWTSDPASRVLSLWVHVGSWTGGEEPRPRRLKGSGWTGAAQATWTSTPCRLVSTQPCRMVETVP